MATSKILVSVDHGNSCTVVMIKTGDEKVFVNFTDENVRHPSNIFVAESDDGPVDLVFSRDELPASRMREAGVINLLKMVVGMTRVDDVPPEVSNMLLRITLDEGDGGLVFKYKEHTIPVREVLRQYFSHVLDRVNEHVNVDAVEWVFGIAIPLGCTHSAMDVYREVLTELRPACRVVFVREMFAAHFSASQRVNSALEPEDEKLAVGVDVGNATAHVAIFSHKKDADGHVSVSPLCTRVSYECSGSAQTLALKEFLSRDPNFKDAPQYTALFDDTYYVQGYKETIMQTVRSMFASGKPPSPDAMIKWDKKLPPGNKQLVDRSYLKVGYGGLRECFSKPVKALEELLEGIKADLAAKRSDVAPQELDIVLTGGGILGYGVRKACADAFPQAANVTRDETTCVAKGVMMYLEYLERAAGNVPAVTYGAEIATHNVALKMTHTRRDVEIVVPLVKKDTPLPILDRTLDGWNLFVGDLPLVTVDGKTFRVLRQEVIEGIFAIPATGPEMLLRDLPAGRYQVYVVDIYLPANVKRTDSFTLIFSMDSQSLKLTCKVHVNKKRVASGELVGSAEAERNKSAPVDMDFGDKKPRGGD